MPHEVIVAPGPRACQVDPCALGWISAALLDSRAMGHTTRRRNQRPGLTILAAALLASCSGTGGGGCAGYGAIPTGRFEGTKTDNAVNLKLSAAGLQYLNDDWQSLVELFAPGQQITVDFPCRQLQVPLVGTVTIADQGQPNGNGRTDNQCTAQDVPARVTLGIVGFELLPRPPDGIYAKLAVRLSTGKIYVSSGCPTCSFEFNNTLNQSNLNILDATVLLKVDQTWDRRMTFEVAGLDGIDVCTAGQAASGRCIEPADLTLEGLNFCGDIVCGIANFAKDALVPYLSPIILSAVQNMANKQAHATCTVNSDCPSVPGATAVCDSGVCVDASTDRPVPRLLGVEGRLKPGALLGNFGVSPEAALDVSIAAGSSARVDSGITLGTRAGLSTVQVGACVVGQPAPSYPTVPAPDFDGGAPTGSRYHVGLAISQPFLGMAAHHAQQSGTLCLGITGSMVGMLNTGLVKTFLPSLGKLVTRDGVDAPMMVALRPGRPPTVEVGQGTYDPVTKKPIDPLLTLVLDQLQIDFYSLVDERYVRLFTLTADVKLPLSLIFNGCSSLQPAMGDLRQVITNIRTTRSEMLAEDPTLLTDLIPAVLGLAEPALAQMLSPFEMPDFAGYRLRVDAFRGITPNASGRFHHLGLFASLISPNVACGVAAPRVSAELAESRIPPTEAMRLTGQGLPLPAAVLRVGTPGSTAEAEYAWRVDGGLWSTFAPAPSGLLEVAHGAFLLQGTHRIEVQARHADRPHGVSAPAAVSFTVDFSPPEVTLTPDGAADRLRVVARDNVSPDEALGYAYRVGPEGAFSAFGPARPIDLSSVVEAGGVTVRVMDAAGNVAEATWADSEVHPYQLTPRRPHGATGGDEGAGCSATGGVPASAGLIALLAWLRRRRA